MKIALFETLAGFGGGNIYQRNIFRALESHYPVEIIRIPGYAWLGSRLGKVAQVTQAFKQRTDVDLWICTFLPTISQALVQPKGNVISLFYHLDDTFSPHPVISRLLSQLYFEYARKCVTVVTIAEYWKKFLLEKDIPDSELIYWGFEPANYIFSPQEVTEFKHKHDLMGKPVIYLGNCQEIKGVVEAYQLLKHFDAHLVTSGVRRVHLPVPNFELSYRDYRLLLAASDVVLTLSKFKEGWNGTAHEAMLAGAPVVGSGLGGMGELLQGGGQLICHNLADLPQHVSYALQHRDELGRQGQDFASQFTLERFNLAWQGLVSRQIG